MKSSGRNEGKIEDHPEYTTVPFTPTEAPLKMMSSQHHGVMFYFSPESLATLKAEASPSIVTEPSDKKWIDQRCSVRNPLAHCDERTVTLGDPGR